jgi:phosphatidylserine/phosphatidylglycerophosphate/cardiolipin synthase-like enzyme
MADLTLQERRQLEDFLGASGNDWFLTHAELSQMFEQYQLEKYNLNTELLAERIGFETFSKRKRLSKFWTTWPNLVVSKFLLELLDYAFLNHNPSNNYLIEIGRDKWISELEKCKQIAISLRHKSKEEGEAKIPSPYFENQRELILADLEKAKQVIWICMYLFTDYKIARKVLQKHQEGVTVEIILQDHEANRREELQNEFWNKLPSVLWWYPKTDGGINHHKFCIIDGRKVWHGSFNFTPTAANKNQEDYTRDDNLENVGKFSDKFRSLKLYLREEKRMRRQF